MSDHAEWVRQIDAELDGELTLEEAAALARHLSACAICARTRVSHLELRLSLARSAGQPGARRVPRPPLLARTVTTWLAVCLAAGAAGGWLAHARWGGPGRGPLEASRASFVVP